MLTKAKLKELKKAWNSNMADAEVGPLLEHITEQDARISALESSLAERERECEARIAEMASEQSTATDGGAE